MQIERRGFVRSLLALGAALAIALPAVAQTSGGDYTLIAPPQLTDEPAKIEVIEFFSYGCPHCAEFNPALHNWATKLPADVVFKKVPISFNRPAWAALSRLYYTLEVTGDLARLDDKVFKAYHEDRVSLYDEATMREWAVKNGVDPKTFSNAFNSFSVQSKLARAEQLGQAYRIQGIPALVVDGKYLIAGKDYPDMLANATKVIAKVRSERAATRPADKPTVAVPDSRKPTKR